MSATISLWIPVLFLANAISLFWVLISRLSARNRQSRNTLNVPKSTINTKQVATVFPTTLVWKSVRCIVGTGVNRKTILHGISGRVSPGEVAVLMGPSGAGKSTLLDILALRPTKGTISGEILVNEERRMNDFVGLASYVPQEDHFIPSLSCQEVLQFYAGLLLCDLSKTERNKRILEVLDDLGLTENRHIEVGGVLPGGIRVKGLSGGQKRRLNIAIGVISSPSIVFMDELTTGLDSFTALSVMRFVKNIGLKNGHSIVITIHQPRLDIWNLFSRVTLLSKGMVLFEGKPGKVLPWFTTNLGYIYDQTSDGTVPEWCLDLIAIDFTKDPTRHSICTFAELQRASETFLNSYDLDKGTTKTQIKTKLVNEPSLSETSISLETPKSGLWLADVPVNKPNFKLSQLATFCLHFSMLSWRCFAFITRNPSDVAGRLFTISAVATFLGAVFYNISEGPESMTTRFNVLFMSPLVLVLFPYLSVSHATADKVHSTSTSLSTSDHARLITSAIFALGCLRKDSTSLFQHVVILILAYLIFSQILSLAAILAPSEDLTFMIGVCFVAFNLMFSDFFIRKDQMKFQWLSSFARLSPMKYIFEALTQIEFLDRIFYSPCVADFEANYDAIAVETRALIPLPKPALSFVIKGMSDEQGNCAVSGNGFLTILGNQRSTTEAAVILISFLLAFHFITFLMLWCLSRTSFKR